MSKATRLAAFDLDGTLLNSIPSIVIGVRTCWEVLGFPEVSDDQIRDIIGLPWEESVQILIPGAGAREVGLINDYHAEIARGDRLPPNRPPEEIFTGAAETLDRFEQDGYLLAIVTSRSNRRFYDLLEQAGLSGRFSTVKTADLGPGKPDPYLLNQAMADVGAEPTTTVMIGDTTYDIMTGRNAGTGAIGVTWGVHPNQKLKEAGAHHVAFEFGELHDYAAGLTSEMAIS
ncbi:MAG: HAD-IA family hydrolase [Pseudomonadota bacterium]|nr:HAD-IA family hydrolase [Pseudomonadota bacterium]